MKTKHLLLNKKMIEKRNLAKINQSFQ